MVKSLVRDAEPIHQIENAHYLRELVALLPGLPRLRPNLSKPCIGSRHIRAAFTGYPMNSCRLSIISSGSMTDHARGTPLSQATLGLRAFDPLVWAAPVHSNRLP